MCGFNLIRYSYKAVDTIHRFLMLKKLDLQLGNLALKTNYVAGFLNNPSNFLKVSFTFKYSSSISVTIVTWCGKA